MIAKQIMRIEYNHSDNLEVLLNELRRQLSNIGGFRFNHLVLECGVSSSEIHGYLNEVYTLGYEILKNIRHDSDSLTGNSVNIVKRELNMDSPCLDKSSEQENLIDDINSARLYIMELIRQLSLNNIGNRMFIDKNNYKDAITVSRHTFVHSELENVRHTMLH